MYCHILRVRAIPTLESTDSMIMPVVQLHYINTTSTLHQYYKLAHYIMVQWSDIPRIVLTATNPGLFLPCFLSNFPL